MLLSRLNFILGALAAPAVIRTPGLLMPVKAIEPITLYPYQKAAIEALEALPPGVYNMTLKDVVRHQMCPRKIWLEFRVAETGSRVTQEITL